MGNVEDTQKGFICEEMFRTDFKQYASFTNMKLTIDFYLLCIDESKCCKEYIYVYVHGGSINIYFSTDVYISIFPS